MIELNNTTRKYLDWSFNASLILGMGCLLASNSLFQLSSPFKLLSETNWAGRIGILFLMMALIIATWRKNQSVGRAILQLIAVCMLCMFFLGVPYSFFKITVVLYFVGVWSYVLFLGYKEIWGDSGSAKHQTRNEFEKK